MSDKGTDSYVTELIKFVNSQKKLTNGRYKVINLMNLSGHNWPMYIWHKL